MLINKAAEKAIQEQRIQDALKFIHEFQGPGQPNLRSIARQFKLPESTLRARCTGTHQPRAQAHAGAQFLSPAQEAVLVDWCHHLGRMSIPLSRETVRAKAAKIRGDGTVPSNSWFKRYVRRNSDTLVFKKPSGLDPKRAKGFNRPTVEAHLAEFETMLREFEIPWENVYNMDEKGIQLGGGRKGSQRKFLFSREQREWYKIKSDDLELVTVIEAVCADGMAPIKPGFVLQGGDLGEWWAVQCCNHR